MTLRAGQAPDTSGRGDTDWTLAVGMNVPAGAVDISGGIAVVGDPVQIATENTIKFNTAFGNSPVDLFWDQQGDNTFIGNRCNTSDPDGLCVKGHGHGDGHHGDNGHHGDKHGKHNHKHHKHHDD